MWDMLKGSSGDWPEPKLQCKECGADGFGDVSIRVIKKGIRGKETSCNIYVCQSCGYKWMASEVGYYYREYIIVPKEPPSCNAKPKQLPGGGT